MAAQMLSIIVIAAGLETLERHDDLLKPTASTNLPPKQNNSSRLEPWLTVMSGRTRQGVEINGNVRLEVIAGLSTSHERRVLVQTGDHRFLDHEYLFCVDGWHKSCTLSASVPRINDET